MVGGAGWRMERYMREGAVGLAWKVPEIQGIRGHTCLLTENV